MTREREHDRRDDEQVRDAVLLNGAEHSFEVEPRHRHDGAPVPKRVVEDDDEPVDVEEREDAEGHLTLVGAQMRTELTEVRDDVLVREHHAFAHSGRPARVRQRDDILGGIDRHRRRFLIRLQQVRERALAEDENVLDVCADGRFPGLLDERRRGDDEARPGVAQLETQLVRRKQRIRRVHDSSERRDRVEGERVLREIRRVDAEHVAATDSVVGEAGGDTTDALGEVTVGQDPSRGRIHERGFLTAGVRAFEHEGRQRNVGDLDVRKRASVDHARAYATPKCSGKATPSWRCSPPWPPDAARTPARRRRTGISSRGPI